MASGGVTVSGVGGSGGGGQWWRDRAGETAEDLVHINGYPALTDRLDRDALMRGPGSGPTDSDCDRQGASGEPEGRVGREGASGCSTSFIVRDSFGSNLKFVQERGHRSV